MHMSRMLKKILLGLVFFSQNMSAVLLEELIDSRIREDIQSATFSMLVYDPESNRNIYEHNPNKALTPASNTKMFPAIASLYELGQYYQYRTEVGFDPRALKNNTLKKNLYFRFSGDPSFKITDLREMVAWLKSQGIRKIQGNIILDTNAFELPDIAAGTSYDDLPWYYAAKTPALILNENAFRVYFRSNHNLNQSLIIEPIDDPFGLRLNVNVLTVSQSFSEKYCDLVIEHSSEQSIHVSGCWSSDNQERIEKLSVPSPIWWFQQVLKRQLTEARIQFSGTIKRARWPKEKNFKAHYTHRSEALLKLLQHMMYESDNVYADSILKTLGQHVYHHGNYQSGVRSIKNILHKRLGLNADRFTLHDGLGTRYNKMSAGDLVDLLASIYRDESIRPVFMSTLPLSGKRGSLKERMKDSDLAGRVYAKTGKMHDVSSLAGYLIRPNKKVLIFAMITNHYQGHIDSVKSMEDELIKIILENT